MNTAPHILVAGIGNIFLGDDAFGVEVVRRLARQPLPAGVRLVDFGIRGLDLTYALLDDACDAAILIDAVPRGGAPGTLYVLEPERSGDASAPAGTAMLYDSHDLHPSNVLRLVEWMGKKPPQILIVGCEPRPLDPDRLETEVLDRLSDPVLAAVDGAVELVRALIADLIERPGLRPPPDALPPGRPVEPPPPPTGFSEGAP